ncbi:MAG: glutathione S-transferase family protein [Proteobacteria bacterium]|nr:MAG: glutathione S-transferase family protein [Pseudomonadota bacterium]
MSLVLYHATPSRSVGARALLAELGVPYELKLLNLKEREEYKPEFLAINPMGKVPTIVHDGVVITEQTAIYTYLADAFPAAGLAPAIGDPLRGPYLRWMAFYGSCFEPGVIDLALQREPAPYSMSPYGNIDTVMRVLWTQLEAPGPWFLGEKFTALDVLWAGSLTWMAKFELVKLTPAAEEYLKRVNARPALQKAAVEELKLSGA